MLSVLVLSILSIAVLASNYPTAPRTLYILENRTFNPNNYAPKSIEAVAGNISAITIYAIGQTKSWQGYFGNISGTITLDDANNYTFYNWSAAEPRGEIYATLDNSGIGWDSVVCYNFTGAGADWQTIENYYGINMDDVDGVNETYAYTNHPEFQVGSRTMSGCPTTYIYRDDQAQTNDFVNVLLYDPANPTTGWIYSTIIENKTNTSSNPVDISCYDGSLCDFQILVNEDGHGTDTATTTYYFWVELE